MCWTDFNIIPALMHLVGYLFSFCKDIRCSLWLFSVSENNLYTVTYHFGSQVDVRVLVPSFWTSDTYSATRLCIMTPILTAESTAWLISVYTDLRYSSMGVYSGPFSDTYSWESFGCVTSSWMKLSSPSRLCWMKSGSKLPKIFFPGRRRLASGNSFFSWNTIQFFVNPYF